MAIFIGAGKKISGVYINVGGETKAVSSVWVDRGGTPAKVFQMDTPDPYEVAPADGLWYWNYALDEENKSVVLKNFIRNGNRDVIVYANYISGDTVYKTKIVSEPISSNASLFKDMNLITSIKFSRNIDTGNVTDMRSMFDGCSAMTSLDIGCFNTCNVTSMMGMFSGCEKLASLNLGSFDTHGVTRMDTMFYGCKRLTGLDLSNFDTHNATSMISMFYGCEKLASIDLHSFDTSNVTRMTAMFRGCKALRSLDLGSFDTGKATDMGYMFYDCVNLKTIYASEGRWTMLPSASTNRMFDGCGASGVTYK